MPVTHLLLDLLQHVPRSRQLLLRLLKRLTLRKKLFLQN